MAKILVTGANGQVGSELKQLSSQFMESDFIFTDRRMLDICNKNLLRNFLNANNIDFIINCAAYTAVDNAEKDEQAADTVNHIAVFNLAKEAKDRGIKLVHISTDYVFDGKNFKPYIETDDVNPQSVYGKTKLAGEQSILEIAPEGAIIIRTSWVYSSFGSNFVKTMLKLGKEKDEIGVIFDQIGTPTYAKDLAEVILNIIHSPEYNNIKPEIYHFSNEGVCSWYDFAVEIMKISKLNCKIKSIESKEYPTPAKRPHYSLLNKSKIKNKFNIQIPHWKDSLNCCICPTIESAY